MSHSCDEQYDVYDERARRARTPKPCSACKETIQPGHRYHKIFIRFDGEAWGVNRCLRCQALHEHLRHLAPGDMWPEERLDCGQLYEDEWGELPEDIATLAFVTPDEAQELLGRKGSVP